MTNFNKVQSTENTNSARSNFGWTSEGLDLIFKTKEEAEKALIHAFGGECGDCGFKSKKEIFDTYPVYRVRAEKPMDFTEDVQKCFVAHKKVEVVKFFVPTNNESKDWDSVIETSIDNLANNEEFITWLKGWYKYAKSYVIKGCNVNFGIRKASIENTYGETEKRFIFVAGGEDICMLPDKVMTDHNYRVLANYISRYLNGEDMEQRRLVEEERSERQRQYDEKAKKYEEEKKKNIEERERMIEEMKAVAVVGYTNDVNTNDILYTNGVYTVVAANDKGFVTEDMYGNFTICTYNSLSPEMNWWYENFFKREEESSDIDTPNEETVEPEINEVVGQNSAVTKEELWAYTIEFDIAERFNEEDMKIGYSLFNIDCTLDLGKLKTLILKKYENGGYVDGYSLEDLCIATDDEGLTLIAWRLRECEIDED